VDDLTRAIKEGRLEFRQVPPPEVDARRMQGVRGRSIGHRTLPGSPAHSGIFKGAHLLDPKPVEGAP
jgi:hypothetical protein